MKRYCGCISPTERRKRPCEDEERNSAKNIAAYFQAAVFFCAVKCLWNGGRRLFSRRPTGTAERNKGNERRETACLPVLFIMEWFILNIQFLSVLIGLNYLRWCFHKILP